MKSKNRAKAIILMILSSLFFSIMQTIVGYLGNDYNVYEKLFFRNLASLLIAFCILPKNLKNQFGGWKEQKYLWTRSFFGFLGLVFLFMATSTGNQGDVSIISKTSPIFVTLLSVIFLKERVSKEQILALILTTFGAVLVYKPDMSSEVYPLLFALISSIASAIAYLTLSKISEKIHGMTIVMHFSTFSTVMCIPLMLREWVLPQGADWLLLVGIGICGSLGQICLTYAYRMELASEVSIYSYSGIIFSMVLGVIALSQEISCRSVMGALIMFGATLFTYFSNRKKELG